MRRDGFKVELPNHTKTNAGKSVLAADNLEEGKGYKAGDEMSRECWWSVQ